MVFMPLDAMANDGRNDLTKYEHDLTIKFKSIDTCPKPPTPGQPKRVNKQQTKQMLIFATRAQAQC